MDRPQCRERNHPAMAGRVPSDSGASGPNAAAGVSPEVSEGGSPVQWLDKLQSPGDLRQLSVPRLAELAEEMRARICEAVSRNGGHLASNLGVVELTLALHYIYDFGPYPTSPDRLLWDVGHQSYRHTLLTGRGIQCPKFRKKGQVSGFPSPGGCP